MQVNYTGLLGPLRWGVGKLVCDARKYTDRCGGRWCAEEGWVHHFSAKLLGAELGGSSPCSLATVWSVLCCRTAAALICSEVPHPRLAALAQGPGGAALLP